MDIDQIPSKVEELRGQFKKGKTRPLSWRIRQLHQLRRMLEERTGEFSKALYDDLRKSDFEAQTAEIHMVISEIEFIAKNLADWVKPEKVSTPIVHQPAQSYIQREPLGVVLIIGPWNYPIQLSLSPLIGAIAAGNCTLLKPSELAPASSAVMAKWLPEYLDSECIQVIEGGIPETTAVLKEKFDHIFFTGSGHVGKIVMAAAAKHLTPVTLELGGKSPCIVDNKVDLATAARRIIWGKCFNSGQTCVAPDYILAHKDIEPALVEELRKTLNKFYGADPQKSKDLARIINNRNFKRLVTLLGDEEVAIGGETDEEDLYIAPTVLRNVSPDSPIMEEEIFGPILPVLTFANMDEAIDIINSKDKPLALYVFSNNKDRIQQVLTQTSSGGACVNDTITHMVNPHLPFGGVGPSGMGAYHGRMTFETFCHKKSVLNKSTRIDPAIRYPPYSDTKLKWIKRLI